MRHLKRILKNFKLIYLLKLIFLPKYSEISSVVLPALSLMSNFAPFLFKKSTVLAFYLKLQTEEESKEKNNHMYYLPKKQKLVENSILHLRYTE